MSYATVQDLQDRLGTPRLVQLTDLTDPPSGAVGLVAAQKALDDATAEIDGYLVGRLALPLASPPAVLTVHCVTLAHYRLLGAAADEVTREAYKAALKYLEGVARGDILLLPPNQAQPASSGGAVVFVNGQKAFAREEAFYTEHGRGLRSPW